jgi:hypothetical protein
MWTKQLRFTIIALALVAATSRGATAQTSTGSSACLGGAIGCEQVDFFLNFTESTTLNYFRISLRSPGWLFGDPGLGEAEDSTSSARLSVTMVAR